MELNSSILRLCQDETSPCMPRTTSPRQDSLGIESLPRPGPRPPSLCHGAPAAAAAAWPRAAEPGATAPPAGFHGLSQCTPPPGNLRHPNSELAANVPVIAGTPGHPGGGPSDSDPPCLPGPAGYRTVPGTRDQVRYYPASTVPYGTVTAVPWQSVPGTTAPRLPPLLLSPGSGPGDHPAPTVTRCSRTA
eukprot:753871-Hanusia_phi.AAC.1